MCKYSFNNVSSYDHDEKFKPHKFDQDTVRRYFMAQQVDFLLVQRNTGDRGSQRIRLEELDWGETRMDLKF